METTGKFTAKEWLLILIVLVIFGVGYTMAIKAYRTETENRTAAIADSGQGKPNHISAAVKIVSVDPIKGDMAARIEFTPEGSFAKDGGPNLSRDLKLFVNSANGKQEYTFPAGKRMTSIETIIDLYEGEPADYPFDQHTGELTFYFDAAGAPGAAKPPGESAARSPAAPAAPAATPASAPAATPAPAAEDDEKKPASESATPAPTASPAASPAASKPAATPAAEESEDDVPILVNLTGSVSGLRIDADESKDHTETFADIDFHIARATTSFAFSMFIMCIQWLLTISVVCMTFLVVSNRRKVELGMFGFLGSLLFAFPALRNSQPGTPPIGTFGDFLSFFWVEVIIAVCLLTVVLTWAFRSPSK